MAFEVAAQAYDRFMGRYSQQLSPQLADLAGVRAGQRVLDVGCGPGALTAELVDRVGEDAVFAVDPSESFVAAARDRFPGVDVQRGTAEDLPFGDGAFDAFYMKKIDPTFDPYPHVQDVEDMSPIEPIPYVQTATAYLLRFRDRSKVAAVQR